MGDSQFFSKFDGSWTVQEQISTTGEKEVLCSYDVLVRPKGPVPVAALEWRIREDVPTNLRAVKKAATEVGLEGVMASRKQNSRRRLRSKSTASASSTSSKTQTQTNAIRRATVRRPS